VFAIALTVRLINVALLDSPNGFFAESDTLTYWALGTALAHRESFWPTLSSLTDRMPLYPLLLAAAQTAFGNAPRVVAVAQAVIDAGTCALVGALGSVIAPSVGLLAGVLAAFSMTLIVLSSQILTDTVFVFFLAIWLACTARFFLVGPTIPLATIAGVAGGMALATRSSVAPLLMTAAPVMLVTAVVKTRRIAHALLTAGLFAIAAGAPAFPVVWRNATVYGSVSLTSQTGDHLAFWIVPLVAQRANGTPYHETVQRMQTLYEERLAQRSTSEQANPFVQSAVKTEVAQQAMARLPLAAFVEAWLEGMIVNVAAPALIADARVRALPKPNFYATPGASLWQRTQKYFFDDPGLYQILLGIGVIAMIPFLLLQAMGFVMLVRGLPFAAVLALGVLAYFLLLSGPVASPKYRLPIEPMLLVLGAIPLAAIADRNGKRSWFEQGIRS
jgi:4-amino-4-deoxy-L-arabinose transferase-like glycosyltransferase